MINKKIYQDIYDELGRYLVPGWEKLIVYLEYGNASYSFAFYIKTKDGYVKCYDLQDVTDKELDESFKKIDKIVSEERKKDLTALWSNMTMIVTSTGDMHTDFNYTYLSEGTDQYKKTWKEKYLK